jgi:hypothetical protein
VLGWGEEGEVTQTFYAHMNKRNKKKKSHCKKTIKGHPKLDLTI